MNTKNWPFNKTARQRTYDVADVMFQLLCKCYQMSEQKEYCIHHTE